MLSFSNQPTLQNLSKSDLVKSQLFSRVGPRNSEFSDLVYFARKWPSRIRQLQIAGTRCHIPTALLTVPQPPAIFGSAGKDKAKEHAKIIIKQTVKQVQGVRKARTKRVSANEKSVIRKKKAEYAALKRAVKKRLKESKNNAYTVENEKIKSLPAKSRKAARAKLKSEHKAKMSALIKKLPGVGKKNQNELTTLMKQIIKLKW